MDELKFTGAPSSDKVRDTLNRVYGLRPSDYTISDSGEGTYSITINSKDMAANSKILISTDGGAYHGYLNCYPAINSGRMHTYEEILACLEEEGVVQNVDESAVKSSFDRFATGEIVENVMIAEGVEPIPGRDAEIVVHFGKSEKRPKMASGGKIDYKNVDNIIMVRKGDVLITKKPASLGVRGINIKREEVVPIPGKDYVILVSDGATVNETGTVYTAMIDGYVDYNGKKLGVYPVYVVKKDVDYSVGNIKFNGSVHVCGDVFPGFKIEADGHILVDGLCQDCELIAKGNVILKTGMKSSGAGFIKAGGSAIIGYAEQTKVHAKQDIEVRKYAFNCELFAGNNVEALSGEGIIAGGTVRAFSSVSIKQLGTQGNFKFTVITGSKYYIEFELERLRRERQRIRETLDQIDKALSQFDLSRDKIRSHPKVQKSLEVKASLDNLLRDLGAREDGLIKDNRAKNPKIKVKDKVFEGVTIMFFNVASVIREPMSNVVFYLDEKYSEVAWVSLKDINSIETDNA